MFISVIVGGAGICIMIMLVPENYAYYSGLMLVFSAGYFFIKLRFFLATIAGWIILLIYNLGVLFYAQTPSIELINTNFFFISANLIGMFAAYNIEYYARRNFSLNYELDKEKLLVENINKNLERTIETRTTELLLAKEQAELSERLKSAFLVNMSHEIRTPMNGILGFAELLKEPELSGEQQQEYVNIITKSGARMLNIINNIVDISKIEAGLMKLDMKKTDINEQIEYIFTFFNPQMEAKGIKFSVNYPLSAKAATITTDSEKVYAIFMNLVKNSIKYTDEGSIELGYERKGKFLEFFVKDTGIGVAEDRQEAIFERFIQADIEDKMAKQGAGLGLSIAKTYVEMLGGKIWLKSKEGIGSIFFFTLPYNTELEEKTVLQKDLSSDKSDNQDSKIKILVAEDDEVSEMLIAIMVKKLNIEILNARSGVEAVQICKNCSDLDLILMDIQMPEMDGYEATRQIREFNKDVIIIAQTADGLNGAHEMAIEAGCNDYISKPYERGELITLIKKYFMH